MVFSRVSSLRTAPRGGRAPADPEPPTCTAAPPGRFGEKQEKSSEVDGGDLAWIAGLPAVELSLSINVNKDLLGYDGNAIHKES